MAVWSQFTLQTVEMLVHMFSEAGPEPSTGVPVDCIYTNAPEACHRSLRWTLRWTLRNVQSSASTRCMREHESLTDLRC